MEHVIPGLYVPKPVDTKIYARSKQGIQEAPSSREPAARQAQEYAVVHQDAITGEAKIVLRRRKSAKWPLILIESRGVADRGSGPELRLESFWRRSRQAGA
jgi:hypothetical protein